MSDTTPNVPVEVPASPAADQLTSAFRAVLMALGGWAVGKGWLTEELATALATVILLVWPLVWSQLKARSTHAKLVTVASAAPDSVAVVK